MDMPARLPRLTIADKDRRRFLDKVHVPADYLSKNTCWLWIGTINDSGYGVFNAGKAWYGKSSVNAHRFAYEIWKGQIPQGWDVDHLCHNLTGCTLSKDCFHRVCVRPDHLELETVSDNRGKRTKEQHIARAVARGLVTSGSPCSYCKAPVIVLNADTWFCSESCDGDTARRAA